MPTDYRSTLGFLALRERAANQERQRAEIAQKLINDRAGTTDSVRQMTNLMELAVRSAGQKQRSDISMARMLAEGEGALGRERTEFTSEPVDQYSEAAYLGGQASRLPPPEAPMSEEDYQLELARIENQKTQAKAALNNSTRVRPSTQLSWASGREAGLIKDKRHGLDQELKRLKAMGDLNVSRASLAQREMEHIAKMNSDLMGAGYDPNSPEALNLQERLQVLQRIADEDLSNLDLQIPAPGRKRPGKTPRDVVLGTGSGAAMSGAAGSVGATPTPVNQSTMSPEEEDRLLNLLR